MGWGQIPNSPKPTNFSSAQSHSTRNPVVWNQRMHSGESLRASMIPPTAGPYAQTRTVGCLPRYSHPLYATLAPQSAAHNLSSFLPRKAPGRAQAAVVEEQTEDQGLRARSSPNPSPPQLTRWPGSPGGGGEASAEGQEAGAGVAGGWGSSSGGEGWGPSIRGRRQQGRTLGCREESEQAPLKWARVSRPRHASSGSGSAHPAHFHRCWRSNPATLPYARLWDFYPTDRPYLRRGLWRPTVRPTLRRENQKARLLRTLGLFRQEAHAWVVLRAAP